ncbi:MAG: hypothetical protein WCK77_20910, partial [Verrucomicrobiota bacterium]
PWNHYVLPLLDGARTLKEARPDLTFRVYLAADPEILVEDLVAAGCEVMVMKSSNCRRTKFCAVAQSWGAVAVSVRKFHTPTPPVFGKANGF